MSISRRTSERFPAHLEVDYSLAHTDDFLFSYIQNISEMGIFIATETPPEVGTELTLRFREGELIENPVELEGTVVWTNDASDGRSKGMGVKFRKLDKADKKRVLRIVRTVAYLPSAGGDA